MGRAPRRLEEREQLEAYRSSHDLAEAVQGAVSPPLWIVRDGNFGWAASTESTARTAFDELLRVLQEVGDCIASRLDGMSDNRSREAVGAWGAREHHDRLKVIEAATGDPPQLVADVEPAFYSEDERKRNSGYPLSAASLQYLAGLVHNPSRFGWI